MAISSRGEMGVGGGSRGVGGIYGAGGRNVNSVYKPIRQSGGTSYGSEVNTADKALGRSMDTGKGKGPQRGVARRARELPDGGIGISDAQASRFPSLSKPPQGAASRTKSPNTPKVPNKKK